MSFATHRTNRSRAERVTLWMALLSFFVVVPAAGEVPGVNAVASSAPAATTTWPGLIGVDYNPNHFPADKPFNDHDVFYVGTDPSAVPITNVYAELAQLKAAGFNTVRSYQTVEYAWIDIIQQAHRLGMSVVYEAVIPQNGADANINSAVSVLKNVIRVVGSTAFSDTVSLVFAGHENYSDTDIDYLTQAVGELRTALSDANVASVPVGSALVGGDLVTPGSLSDMQALIDSYSPSAPLAIDIYPFQYGVMPPREAARNTGLENSVAWDFERVKSQPFYAGSRPILMAETGWATTGTGEYAQYACYKPNDTLCRPGVDRAARYLQAVYRFVRNTDNQAGVLVFYAYDEPTKDPLHPDNAENHYGLFTSACTLKRRDTDLLPNRQFAVDSHRGCQGFVSGDFFTVSGSPTAQPPFTVTIEQTNPSTKESAAMRVLVPKRNRTNQSVRPWPYFLLFDGAHVIITDKASGASCPFTAAVTGSTITWTAGACSKPTYVVNCSGQNCYLPGTGF